MALNGSGEIQAAEARLELAKKAKARSRKNVKAMEAALNAAKREDREAAEDLSTAEAALKATNSKWEVIEVDIDDNKTNKRVKPDYTVTIWEVKSINVSGGGFVALNGLYKKEGVMNDYPYFILKKTITIYEGTTVEDPMLFRTPSGFWAISLAGYHYYRCYAKYGNDVHPLKDAWETNAGFIPPKLSINKLI